MQMLWKEGFGNDPRFKIPRPMRHFEEARLLLEERACGLEFSKYMGRNNRVSRAHARMAGLWLAKLHNLKSAPPGFCTYDAECFALGIFTKELCTALSSLAPQLQEIAKAIRGEFESFREAPVAWVHGDFHPQNILVAQGQVTVIDFDRFCLADPAKDVGSFIAHMRTMACCSGKSLEAVNQEIRAFGDAYLGAASTETAARLEKRVATFVVFSCLEALHYVACVMKVTNADLIGRYLHCAQEAQIERTATWKTWESGAAKPQCP
jgi:aminoglycoside phosphotransferase (APT) family kinase protein